MQHFHSFSLAVAGIIFFATASASADVVVFGDADESAWFDATPGHTTITFAEFPTMTTITDQYAHHGVLFTDGQANVTLGSYPDAWLQDGWGLIGGIIVELEFTVPMMAIAAHFPGEAVFTFFRDDQMVFESAIMGGSGLDWFAGFSVAGGFDRLVLTGRPPFTPGQFDTVNLDNLYFKAIPTPGALAAMLIAGLAGGRRRRDCGRCA